MPRNPVTNVFTRVSNSFSEPVAGTVIDDVDANALFDDYDDGLNGLAVLDGSDNIPVTYFNGGGGASSSTFLRGDGTWATPAVATVTVTITPQGRITLASATPVMTSSQAAKTTVYYTPYVGSVVPIYDGSNFTAIPFAELSQATTDNTKSPAAVAASSVYDLFVWNDAGTMRCTRGPAWTNTTTRSAGTALVMQNGILLNSLAITNGPSASRGTYVGTIASNASSQIDYIFGASAAGGTAAWLGVWNAYNRVSTGTIVTDSDSAYTYNSSTVRQANASAGNQASFVLGLLEEAVQFSYSVAQSCPATLAARCKGGVGFDVTNAFSRTPFYIRNSDGTNTYEGGGTTSGQWLPSAVGFHTIAAVENSPDNSSAVSPNLTGTNALEIVVRN